MAESWAWSSSHWIIHSAGLVSFSKNHFKEIICKMPARIPFETRAPQVKVAKTFFFPKSVWDSEIHGNNKDKFVPASGYAVCTSGRWIISSMWFLKDAVEEEGQEACSGSYAWWKTSGHQSPWIFSLLILWNPSLVVLFILEKFVYWTENLVWFTRGVL